MPDRYGGTETGPAQRHTLEGVVTTNGLGRLTLRDGRRLDTYQGGDPEGPAVVYFHGTPAGRLQAALGDGPARRAGVRLLAFSRPGYGGSSDAPTTLASVARDAAAVAAGFGVDRFACLGASGGGPFALAAAAVLGERVSAVGVAAGIGPVLELDPEAAHDPAIRAALAGDHEAAVVLQDRALMSEGPGPGSRRLGTLVSPEILEPWMPGGRPGVPSYRGVSRDALAFAVGWDIDLADVCAPVHLWYGQRDRMVPLEHGKWLRDHLSTSTLVVREGVGHLGVLIPYWEEMLSSLVGDGESPRSSG